MSGCFENARIVITPYTGSNALLTIAAKLVSMQMEGDVMVLRIVQDADGLVKQEKDAEKPHRPASSRRRRAAAARSAGGKQGNNFRKSICDADNSSQAAKMCLRDAPVAIADTRVAVARQNAETVTSQAASSTDGTQSRKRPGMKQVNRRQRYPHMRCNIEGCGRYTMRTIHKYDMLGPPGFRCIRHGAKTRLCNVPGCGKSSQGKVNQNDEFGPIGFRCMRHGAHVVRCHVEGCGKFAQRKVFETDNFGPPGHRCMRHGAPAITCNVQGCETLARGKVPAADMVGPAGHRCISHGAPSTRRKSSTRPPKVEEK